jgi:hypothetical protein
VGQVATNLSALHSDGNDKWKTVFINDVVFLQLISPDETGILRQNEKSKSLKSRGQICWMNGMMEGWG